MTMTDARRTATTSSKLYQLFTLVFAYPDPAWISAIRAGEVADHLIELFREMAGDPFVIPDRQALSNAGEDDDTLAIEYTRLFDSGPSRNISLYGGHHHGTRMQVMEEVLRYYHHFGIAPNKQLNELPDHLVSELEFMHFLTFREADILGCNGDARHFQRGQQDFLARQLGRWAPTLHTSLAAHQPLPFFAESTRLLTCFLQQDQQRLWKPCAAMTA